MGGQPRARLTAALACLLACLVFMPSFWIIDAMHAQSATAAESVDDFTSAIYFDESRVNRTVLPDHNDESVVCGSEEWDPTGAIGTGPADSPGHSAFAHRPTLLGYQPHPAGYGSAPTGQPVDVPHPPPDQSN